MKWTILRYCFKENKVTRFHYCDNCGHHFCVEHAEWEEDEYNGQMVSYPVHQACL